MESDLRWVQRLQNLRRAHARLAGACALERYTELELAGLIQTFEFTFELCWKTLNDRLTHEGLPVSTPREAITQAFRAGWISDVEIWYEMLGSRNLFSHMYAEEIPNTAEQLIRSRYVPLLDACISMLAHASGAA